MSELSGVSLKATERQRMMEQSRASQPLGSRESKREKSKEPQNDTFDVGNLVTSSKRG